LQLEGKKKFLIAFSANDEAKAAQEIIDRHIIQTQFVCANSTADANVKIANDPPHILVLELHGEHVNGKKLTSDVLSDQKIKNMPILLVGEIPHEEIFVDEIVLGRVQLIDDLNDEKKLSRCLSRLLNFITRNEGDEFHLRFLAPGDLLIKQGEEAKNVYIVRRGQLEASIEKDGKKIVLGPVDTGEFVG